jgi:hypothetical protein
VSGIGYSDTFLAILFDLCRTRQNTPTLTQVPWYTRKVDDEPAHSALRAELLRVKWLEEPWLWPEGLNREEIDERVITLEPVSSPSLTPSPPQKADRAPYWQAIATNDAGTGRTYVLDCSDVEGIEDSEEECWEVPAPPKHKQYHPPSPPRPAPRSRTPSPPPPRPPRASVPSRALFRTRFRPRFEGFTRGARR